ncbi:hypothetical protein SAMN05216570_3237 [Dyella sp. OK004]|uniref:hypothetical protein n=1 Tax=Dyella sp. OK004 TaxID=1855292 RepID=UPI0008E512C6|nr:hypothetical protein [Dyella sp. OK004]SFS15211.1 hypothetical protein SAMN05216570_3237 [Dyella sp. OK004]
MNTHHPDDERLPGEEELAALYRKLPQKEPGPALDAAVLRAAARAVQPAHRRRARWPVALSSAAVLVLAAGLGWRMRDMPVATAPSAPGATTLEAQPAPTVAANAGAAPAAAEQLAAKQAAPEQPEVQANVVATQPAPALVQARRNAHTNAPAMKSASGYAPVEQPLAMSRAETAPAQAQAQAQAADQAIAYDHPAALVSNEAVRAKAAPATRMMAAPAPMAAAAPAPAPPMAPPVDTARDAHDTPAQELDKIRHLLTAGQRDEARQRLADLHRDHPDYPLPDDLREQLLTP